MQIDDYQFGDIFETRQEKRLAVGQLKKEARQAPADRVGEKLTQLFAHAEDPGVSDEALLAILALSQTGKLLPDTLADHASHLLTQWEGILQAVRPLQQNPSQLDWMLDEDYSAFRRTGGILLDILGYLPPETAEPTLRQGLALVDPRLKMMAALSLLRNLQTISNVDLDAIGASHDIRLLFWEQLKQLDMQSVMPARWASSEMLAASDLSRWASSPSELGAPPEEIERMATFPMMVDGQWGDVYLFRFREFPKPWEQDDGWRAGVAGPCHDGVLLRSPWSRFEGWNSRSPEEHFATLVRQ
jgi:hypothetical protein